MKPDARTDARGAHSGYLLRLRVVIERPPLHVQWALQLGKAEHTEPSAVESESVTFELTVRAISTAAGTFDFRGDYVYGPRGARFVYLCSGSHAGDLTSCWNRRAKVSLMTLTVDHITAVAAAPDLIFEGRILGTARDGGPACASIPLLSDGWQLIARRGF